MLWRQRSSSAPPRRLDGYAAAAYKRPVLKDIFTWWFGATIGARNQIRRSSKLVGHDELGNAYYESTDKKFDYDGRNRRFVIYKGYADASKVSPDWHGWLHHTFAEPPTREPLKRREWEKDHLPNLTGTIWAWRPKGSLARGGERQAATADYEPWTPD
jgi:NADH:ubiquinone oxidoreductase subunit